MDAKIRGTEGTTEDIFKDFYKNDVLNNRISIERQYEIPGASKSKPGVNSGYADFIVRPQNRPDTIFIVECKGSRIEHSQGILDITHYHKYCRINKLDKKNIVRIATSGSHIDHYKASYYINGEEYHLDRMMSLSEIFKKLDHDHAAITKTELELERFAKTLHIDLRDIIALTEAQKPLIVSAFIMALLDVNFRNTYRSLENSDTDESMSPLERQTSSLLVAGVMSAIKKSLRTSNINPDYHDVILKDLSFIKTVVPLFEINNEKHTNLYTIIHQLDEYLFTNFEEHSNIDLLGNFYSEFIKYTGGDGSGLGIVLTPRHVADLMLSLADLQPDSVVHDPCMGTGGFLVAAKRKLSDLNHNTPDAIKNITDNQLCGAELQSSMYTMAIANMMFKGGCNNNIINRSCFDTVNDMRECNPTISILNPPYSQKLDGARELDFILHSCNILNIGGKCVAIVPQSTFIDASNVPWKEELLSKHTVEAVISMPDGLFRRVATNVCIIVIKANIPHSANDLTYFYDLDDGYVTIIQKGRVNKNYESQKKQFLDDMNRKKIIPNISAYAHITPQDEWVIEAFAETDYSGLEPKYFAKSFIGDKLKEFSESPFTDLKKLNMPELELGVDNWGLFNYQDIFKLESGKDYSANEATSNPGDNSLIGASEFNNGVTVKTSLENKREGGCITVAKDGSVGSAFYQTGKFSLNGHVTVLRLLDDKPLSKNIGLFLCALIELEKPKYGFKRAWGLARMRKSHIRLPIDSSGNIDWVFIETYMKQIEG